MHKSNCANSIVHNYHSRTILPVTDRGELPSGALIFLSRDPEEHHQIILCSGRPPSGFNTINQISLRARNLTVLKAIHKKVSEMDGVTDIQTVSHGNALSTYFRDPEGNRVEVFVDAPFYCEQPQRVKVDIHASDATIWRKVATVSYTGLSLSIAYVQNAHTYTSLEHGWL